MRGKFKTNKQYNLTEGIVLKKLLLLLSLLCPLIHINELFACEEGVSKKVVLILDVFASKKCGEIKLNRYEDRFSLSINDKEQDIPHYMVSKPLRNMKPKQLAAFLSSGYLSVKECSDGNFILDSHGRLRGGGVVGGLGGYVAGEVVGKAVVYVGGLAVLFGTQKVIRICAGSAAEEAFAEKMQSRFLPKLWDVSEKVAHATGIGGAVIGGVVSPG